MTDGYAPKEQEQGRRRFGNEYQPGRVIHASTAGEHAEVGAGQAIVLCDTVVDVGELNDSAPRCLCNR